MKMWCLQVWNLFEKFALHCFQKKMGYLISDYRYFLLWYFDFKNIPVIFFEAVNFSMKGGGNDVWRHFAKNLVGHAHIPISVLCVRHTILTQKRGL